MKSRYYIAPMIGTGTIEDPVRSMLNNLIDVHQGETFETIDNPKERVGLNCVWALDATHAAIEAHPDVLVVSELFDDESDKQFKLEEKAYDFDKDLEKKVDDGFDKLKLKAEKKADKKPEYKVKDRIKIMVESTLDEQNASRPKYPTVYFGGYEFF